MYKRKVMRLPHCGGLLHLLAAGASSSPRRHLPVLKIALSGNCSMRKKSPKKKTKKGSGRPFPRECLLCVSEWRAWEFLYLNNIHKTTLNNIHKTKHKNNTISKQYKYVRGPLRECRSIRSGASGLPYYCAPLVCVSDVIDSDSLAEWWHNKPKNQKTAGFVCFVFCPSL